MYFHDRVSVGNQLAQALSAYKGQPNAVIALSDGGVLVARPIAESLQAILTMLLLEPVSLPGENDTLLTVREDGNITYDEMWSPGQLEEFEMEYRTYIEQAKQQHYSQLRQALGVNCIASSDLLHDRNIILVSDGFKGSSALQAAADFLKPVKRLKLVVAVPNATPNALDEMRQLADEVVCLDTIANYFDTDHYYEENTVPAHAELVSFVEAGLPK
jgi:putative phosphoribosyl transferase